MNRRWFLKAIGTVVAAAVALPRSDFLFSALPPYTEAVSITGHDPKIVLVKKLIQDAIDAHDRAIEEALFNPVAPGLPASSLYRDWAAVGGWSGTAAERSELLRLRDGDETAAYPHRNLGVSIEWSEPPVVAPRRPRGGKRWGLGR